MTSRSHKLTLLENSHSFMAEAVRYAISAREDIRRWPFAILNVVQATELSLKEFLRREHPLLIYENVDNPQNTVSLSKALPRIEQVLGHPFSEDDKKKIASAVKIRNVITHHEFDITEELAMAKFSELFAFWVYFQARYLEIEVEDALDPNLLDEVRAIEKCCAELRSKAFTRILDEDIDPENILTCPDCYEDTLVADGTDCRCYLCRNIQTLKECPHCDGTFFEFEMEDFSNLIDTDLEAGRGYILNDYGYQDFKACSQCFLKIQYDIEHQQDAEFYRNLEEEEWHSSGK